MTLNTGTCQDNLLAATVLDRSIFFQFGSSPRDEDHSNVRMASLPTWDTYAGDKATP